MLRLLMIALPAATIGWKRIDFFDRELVCVHVYDPAQELPQPLLEPAGSPTRKPADHLLFHVGLPELVLCRSTSGFLQRYPYFLPITRSEVSSLQDSIRVLHQVKTVKGKKDIDSLQAELVKYRQSGKENNGSLAVIFTLNESTTAVCAAVVDACRGHGVNELVIFKDPSRPPYLCSYPSRQKGFKRPPPIG